MSAEVSELSVKEGGEAYIRYCSGIAVIQSPVEWSEAHLCHDLDDITEEKADVVLGYAERLMMSGLKRFIQASLPSGVQMHKAKFSDETETGLLTMLDEVFDTPQYASRIERINSRYSVLRPAPFLRHAIFTELAHSKYGRVKTIDLLDDDYAPNPILEPWLKDRLLSSPRAHAQRRSGLSAE